jgi:acyl-coenzyme A synthetase/AMP-(fatty) acid ligase
LEAAAVESPDDVRGMVVKAFIVLREGQRPSESLAAEIQEFVKRTIAPYKYPRKLEFVSSLPKTTSGKIRRRELRERERHQ